VSAVINPEASAQVLRNAGIPVKTYTLATTSEGALVEPYQRAVDEFGEPLQEWRYVRVSNAVMAQVESPTPMGWGSTDAWEKDLQTIPFQGIARTLAIVWKMVINVDGLSAPDWERAAEVLIDGEIESYSLAVGNAFLLAQGVDPQRVGEHLREELTSLQTQRAAVEDLVAEETVATVKRRNEFVDAQKQPSDSEPAEPTLISPSLFEEDPNSSEHSVHGSELVTASTPSGT
jgi:hypothetical protein